VVDEHTTLRQHIRFATTTLAIDREHLDAHAPTDHVVTGAGFTPDEAYGFTLYGRLRSSVGTVRADATGAFTVTLTVAPETASATCLNYVCQLLVTPDAPGSLVSYSLQLRALVPDTAVPL
jgi:hypothetical protein